MAERFFIPQPPSPGPFTLEGPEAHHLGRVSRIPVGSAIVLFCGDGLDYPAQVVRLGKREVELEVQPAVPNGRERRHAVIVAAPLPKADRGHFLIEKLTELGVAEFIPLETQRTVAAPSDGKTDKLRRAVIEAAKQCGRSVLMRIGQPVRLAAFFAADRLPARRFLGDALGPPWEAATPPQDTLFLVGPEGGLTADERDAALAAGFRLVGLGPMTLRIETAAIALAALAGT